ncbi:MAG: hypothetical protein ACAI35_01905 [Candidatus Methylacidiphilales bacterium]
MKMLDPLIERHLGTVSRRRNGITAWQWLLGIGCAACVLQLLLLMGITSGLVRDYALAIGMELILVVAVSLLGLAALTMSISRTHSRSWLAGVVEDTVAPLQDRLNTLVHLENLGADPAASQNALFNTGMTIAAQNSFFKRIQKQTRKSLPYEVIEPPFSRAVQYVLGVLFAVLLVINICYLVTYRPWDLLTAATSTEAALPPKSPDPEIPPEKPLEKPKWGEVRITEPGKDLTITKVDVVQLQIEAASRQKLVSTKWYASINGGAKQEFSLDKPQDAHYAVFQPVLYTDELGLKEWDLVSYHAVATTDDGSTYSSDLYFLEVRPFREDLVKMQGQAGKGREFIDELSRLIQRQKQMLQENYRHVQRNVTDKEKLEEEVGKLTSAQQDLAAATRHLYSRIAAEENTSIGAMLDNLAAAQDSMGEAIDQFQQKKPPGALPPQQDALARLIAARKDLVKAIMEHPDEFKDSPKDDANDGRSTTVTSFRREEQEMLEKLAELADKQRKITSEANPLKTNDFPKLAEKERALQKEFQELADKHKEQFAKQEDAKKAVDGAMDRAGKSFDEQHRNALRHTRIAAENLEKLHDRLSEKSEDRKLTDAYKLRDELKKEIQRLEAMEQKPLSREEAQDFAQKASETTAELARIAPDLTKAGEIKPALNEHLTPERQADIEKSLEKLGAAKDPAAQKQAAGQSLPKMKALADAFDKSLPQESSAQNKPDAGQKDAADQKEAAAQKPNEGQDKEQNPGDKDQQQAQAAAPGKEPGKAGDTAAQKPGDKAKGEKGQAKAQGKDGKDGKEGKGKDGKDGEQAGQQPGQQGQGDKGKGKSKGQQAKEGDKGEGSTPGADGKQGQNPAMADKPSTPAPGMPQPNASEPGGKSPGAQQGQAGMEPGQDQAATPGPGQHGSPSSLQRETQLAEAVRQLESLHAQSQRPIDQRPSPEDMNKAKREVMANLREAMQETGPNNSDSPAVVIMRQAEESLEKRDREVPAETLKSLLHQIEAYRAEIGRTETDKREIGRVQFDPSAVPAAYRDRIHKYFEMLSEK